MNTLQHLCLLLLFGPGIPGYAADLAIVGATIIDGNGGPPLTDATVAVSGSRITAVGPKTSISVPTGATAVDGSGGYVVPGFIDTNVHLSLYGGARDRYESLAKYFDREDEIVVEAAQIQLKYGVTRVEIATAC